MKNKLFGLLLLLFVTAGTFEAAGQDLHFSQFFEAPLLRNPSLAGIFSGDLRFQAVYRNQWSSVTVPYQTGSFDFEYKKPIGQESDFITTGLQVMYDRAGTTNFTTSEFFPAINYHKSLSEYNNKYLSLGFMGGLVQRRIDRSKITTNSTYDNGTDGETYLNPNYSYLDGSVGMTFNSSIAGRQSDNYFVGLAYHHFNRPKSSFYNNPEVQLKPKWVVSAGARFSVSETSFFTLQGDYNTQGPYKETIAGALYSHKIGEDMDNPDYTLHFGAFLRWKDAIIPVVKLDYNPFAVAVSYDVNVSDLKTASQSRGGMEISISYIGFFERENSSRDAVRCPKF